MNTPQSQHFIFFVHCKAAFPLAKFVCETMEQRILKNVNNRLNAYIYSYLETSGVQNCNIYLNVVHFFNTSVN